MAAFLQSHGVKATPGEGWKAVECPFHDDTTASASFNEGKGKFRCHGCGISGTVAEILAHLGEDPAGAEALPRAEVAPEVTRAPITRDGPVLRALRDAAADYHEALMGPEGMTNPAKNYLVDRGFSREAVVSGMLGVVDDPAPGHEMFKGRLAIPYITTSGVIDIRFRCLKGHDCKQSKCPKYLGIPGNQTRMYEARQVLAGGGLIAVCEGELDTLTMIHEVGIPAVGIPGANNWHDHYPLVLSGFDLVLVLGDGDDAGRKFASEVAAAVENGIAAPLPDGEDVNSLTLRHGPEHVRSLILSHVAPIE